MGRKPKPPTAVVRLPVDVIEALRLRAARKGMPLGDYLRDAMKLPTPKGDDR